MKLPKIIIFDVGGTLTEAKEYTNIENGYRYLYDEVLDVKESFFDFMQFVKTIRPYIKKREETHLEFSFMSFFNYLSVVYGLKTDLSYYEIEQNFVSKYYKTSLVEGSKDLLDFLKSKDIKLYVLSNSMYSTAGIIYELKINGIDKYFEQVVSSGDHLLRKPSLDLFKMYLKKFSIMGYKKSEICYIGNMYDYDVVSPVKLGMKVIHKGENNIDHNDYVEVNDYHKLIEMWKR